MHLPAEFRARANCGIGAVVDLRGRASHQILRDAITILERLDHRGARGAEENTGDGAGVMLQKPDAFFRRQIDALPAADAYGVGQLFLPRDPHQRIGVCARTKAVVAAEGFRLLGWREVPTEPAGLGRGALESEPCVRQLFVADVRGVSGAALDRRLYILRLALERAVEAMPGGEQFYVCSLDRRRLVYKGLLTNAQLRGYYPDLADPALVTALAIVHSRFSTNTLGSWPLAHPHRVVVHNGEINTYRGNFNRLRAREADLQHPELGTDLQRLRPLVKRGVSDTALLDAALELLLAGGRNLPHALRMLIPAAWEKNPKLAPAQRDWYDYHSTLMEPWDGPALVVATDGVSVAAVLDRNGFRPCRYDLTHDDRMILASEVGVLDLSAGQITHRGRLAPGQMLLIDPAAGGLQSGEAVFAQPGAERYGRWLREERLKLAELAPPREAERGETLSDLAERQGAAGYTFELLERLLRPMAEDGKDPIGAMGDDAPPASVSAAQRGLFDFFKQTFAQVSNPPIDYLREDLVTSLATHLGPQPNLLAESAAHCRRIQLATPMLTNGELAALRGLARRGFISHTLDLSFGLDEAMESALDRLCAEAEAAAARGVALLVLSDRGAAPRRLALPSLLAVGAVHQQLIRAELRLRTALVLEVSDACSVHHLCSLIGFGADAVNPWLALASVRALSAAEGAIGRYLHALDDGLLKVMSKMGISTLESYKGGQLFEALGLAPEVVARCFTGSVSRIGGANFARLEADLRSRHEAAYQPRLPGNPLLAAGGSFYWRRDGEHHDWNPETLGMLQAAVRSGDERLYRGFSALVDAPAAGPTNLRGLLTLKLAATPVPLAEVESIESITRRFFSGAMSLGALSPEAHETLAIGMNRGGGVAHTGEGGEPQERFGTERECRNKQVASGRFGVTAAYLAAAEQLEIKMAQGAKPGEGGQLPADKVDEMIARLRHTTPGVGLISPPPHHDIYSIEDLAQLIHDLRCASPRAQIHVKLVAEAGVGTIAAGVVKAGADTLLIAGDSGGTGAATKTSIKSAGVPWELGLAEAQRVLVENRLRSRVSLRTDGGLKTGRDVIVAALLGAEEYGFGMAALVTLGCIMLRKCHCNTCSVGIATQDPELRKRFPGKPEHVVNYLRFVAAEVREHMAALGVRKLDELIGRVDLLSQARTGEPRLDALDLSVLLTPPAPLDALRRTGPSPARASDRADAALIEAAAPALEHRRPVLIRGRIGNSDRSVGTRLSYELTRRYGSAGLPDGTIRVQLSGSAGQSLGAFLNHGIELIVTGAANDYVGKGLCGGRIALRAPKDAGYDPGASSMAGNAILYGATAGELYCHGLAGERFAVRNSGACAVVEGVGDHGCEYMTGGAVLVLGSTGRNFAAGMSGGEAYLLADEPGWRGRLNNQELHMGPLSEARDLALVARLLHKHLHYTGSARAAELLADWPTAAGRLVKLIPKRYEHVLAERLSAGEDLRTPLPAPARPGPVLAEA